MRFTDEVASHDKGYITYIDWLEFGANGPIKCVPSLKDLKLMEEKKIIKSKDGNNVAGSAWHKVSVETQRETFG